MGASKSHATFGDRGDRGWAAAVVGVNSPRPCLACGDALGGVVSRSDARRPRTEVVREQPVCVQGHRPFLRVALLGFVNIRSRSGHTHVTPSGDGTGPQR